MRLAIEAARRVPAHPFGAVIVCRSAGECLAIGVNRSAENPIIHGEIDAINRCASAYPGADWTDLALYTTAEPCPMCQAAILWAGISELYFGTSIPQLQGMGWDQIGIRAVDIARHAPFRKITVVGGILESECDALFERALKLEGVSH
jgi:tRNA(Arg) A34 adenosine deaminase TadA